MPIFRCHMDVSHGSDGGGPVKFSVLSICFLSGFQELILLTGVRVTITGVIGETLTVTSGNS